MMPMPSMSSPGHSGMVPSFKPSLPGMRFIFSNTTLYRSIFLAAAIISLSTQHVIMMLVPKLMNSIQLKDLVTKINRLFDRKDNALARSVEQLTQALFLFNTQSLKASRIG